MPDEIQRGGRRTKKITTAEAKIELEKQESKPAEPEAASTRQESKADRLWVCLRIFPPARCLSNGSCSRCPSLGCALE